MLDSHFEAFAHSTLDFTLGDLGLGQASESNARASNIGKSDVYC